MLKTNDQNNLELSPTKFISWVLAAIISSAVVTTFSLIRIANSDHFTIVALNQRVDSIEENYMPRSEIEREIAHNRELLADIRDDVRKNNELINKLLDR